MQTHTRARSALRQQNGRMEPQGLWSIMHTYTPSSLYLFPPLPFAHSRVPLSSHHPLYLKLPPYFPPSFPLLLSSSTLRHLSSHSIMLLLDAFSLSHFTHIHFPSPLFLPSPFISLLFFTCLFCSPPYCPLNPRSISHSQFPSSFLLPLPDFSSLFIPCCSLPLSLWSLTYLFGADIVVFMRAASPTAAEGRPHNLALVAALGLVRQTDIWTEANKETNKLTNRGT